MNIRKHIAIPALLAMFILILTVGCGGKASGDGYTGKRGQVTGVVTVKGVPLKSGCQILFMGAEKGTIAAGTIGADGRYTLVYERGPGLPIGDYKVQFSPPFTAPGSGSPEPYDRKKVQEEAKAAMARNKDGTRKKVDDGPFPAKYSSTQTSKLKVTVVEGNNKADFDLVP